MPRRRGRAHINRRAESNVTKVIDTNWTTAMSRTKPRMFGDEWSEGTTVRPSKLREIADFATICQKSTWQYCAHKLRIAILWSRQWLMQNDLKLSSAYDLIGPVQLKTILAKYNCWFEMSFVTATCCVMTCPKWQFAKTAACTSVYARKDIIILPISSPIYFWNHSKLRTIIYTVYSRIDFKQKH